MEVNTQYYIQPRSKSKLCSARTKFQITLDDLRITKKIYQKALQSSLCIFRIMFFILVFTFVVNCGLLILLVFADQIIHIALSLCKFHLIHPLPSVPVKESLSTEHGSKLFADAFEKLLDGCRISHESGRHLEAARRNIAHCSLYIIRDPFHEVGTVLILDTHHLLVHLLHGHPPSPM